MLGLLAAYGSDSESESENESDGPISEKEGTKLPNPFESKSIAKSGTGSNPLEKSVFINPYVEADNAKAALLEKHVKMTSTDVKSVNGKNICWNYRKNKCRFGHNCKFAHDSDVQLQTSREVSENNVTQIAADNSEIIEENDLVKHGKKRPGLSATIIPSKKVMKMYNKQKSSN